MASVLSIPLLYKQMTHGFRLGKLQEKFFQEEPWTTAFPLDFLPTELECLFDRPFSYIGRGLQSFVFQSEDERVVIKLFKKKGRFGSWLKAKKQKTKAIDFLEKITKTFQACQIAFTMAQNETGVLYLGLNSLFKKEPTLLIKNHFGLIARVPLDRYAFVIQRKAEPFIQVLVQTLKSGSADQLIDSYLELIYHRTQKGICNTDLSFKNLGFSEGRVIEIDFGNYVYMPEQKRMEWNLWVSEMRHFLENNDPKLLSEYEEKVRKVQ